GSAGPGCRSRHHVFGGAHHRMTAVQQLGALNVVAAAAVEGEAAKPAPAAAITVVVPARNEEATVGQVVERSFAGFAELGRPGEVLVTNDGSTDGTGEVLRRLCERY